MTHLREHRRPTFFLSQARVIAVLQVFLDQAISDREIGRWLLRVVIGAAPAPDGPGWANPICQIALESVELELDQSIGAI